MSIGLSLLWFNYDKNMPAWEGSHAVPPEDPVIREDATRKYNACFIQLREETADNHTDYKATSG